MHKLTLGGILCPGHLTISVGKMSERGLKYNEEQPEPSLLVAKPGANVLCESSGCSWTVQKLHLELPAHVPINEPIGLLAWAAVTGFPSC